VIDIRHLSLSFDGHTSILQDIDFQQSEGEFVAIVGPSGCGKTTLLNLCAGLVDLPPGEHLTLAGHAPALGSGDVAYMLARDSLLPWASALENAAFGLKVRGTPVPEARERAKTMLQRVGLGGYENSLPKSLSHGMRQRVALARTFAMSSPLLLMDEPFGALDAQTKLHLQDLLLQLCQESRRTVMFVTHDLSEAVALADRVVIMSSRPGRIIADIPVPLPRPRSIRALQTNNDFHQTYQQVWKHLESGWESHEG
jgi:NitT/TauT family transport system ATP-binding protein